MLDLTNKIQSHFGDIFAAANAYPWWAVLLVLLIPTIIAIFSRQVWAVLLTAALNLSSILMLGVSDAARAGPVMGLIGLSVVMCFLAFVETKRRRHHAELSERVEHSQLQMKVFLEALDRRSQELDRVRPTDSTSSNGQRQSA